MNNIGPLSVRLFFFFRLHISLFISTAVHPSFCLAARLLLIVTFEEPLFFYHKGCNKLTIIKKEGLIAKGGSSTWGRTTGCTDKSIIQRKFWSKSSWINKPAFDKHVEILLLNCKVCHWCVILLLYCYGILYLLKILICYFTRIHVVFCMSWLAACIFLIGPGVSKFMSVILFYLNNRATSGRYRVEIQWILPKTPNKPNHLYDCYVHININ